MRLLPATAPGTYAGLVPGIGVVWVDGESGVAERVGAGDLVGLLSRDDGWVWVDVPEPDESTAELLTERFGIHPKAASDALARVGLPRRWDAHWAARSRERFAPHWVSPSPAAAQRLLRRRAGCS